MEVHASKTGDYPDHVHGCPEHPGGTAAGKTPRGRRVSDACFWEEDHDEAYRTNHKREHDTARADSRKGTKPTPSENGRGGRGPG